MIKDLHAVFKKHNWSGQVIGMKAVSASASTALCPNGQPPQQVSYKLPDGTWVTKEVCL
jgi:hypothetical protein